ncbi:MAG TPA: ABC-type transport auxiliary lipoprotein family protein [Candidatus Binatia bacterium]|nr:ABC-type transport auxiliary lipoprotein family protein [Candidatus Binatia bacterium]
MSLIRTVVGVFTCFIVAACSIGAPIPRATTYVLELPAATQAAARRPETLRMANVRVAAAFAGDSLVYRMDEVRYTADPYNAFITEPARMLGNRMAEWLDRAGPFQSVAQPDSARGAPYVLEATVTELYGDFRPGRTPAAVVTVQFALLDLTGARSKVVLERTIGRRIEIQQASPDALVRGYGMALAEILAELKKDLERNAAG